MIVLELLQKGKPSESSGGGASASEASVFTRKENDIIEHTLITRQCNHPLSSHQTLRERCLRDRL